jgi:hypothetical protein
MARWWRRWPHWAGYAAAGWSLVYALAGFYWASGGERAFPPAGTSLARPAGWGICVLGLVGAVIALATVRPWGLGVSRRVLAAEAWVCCALAAAAAAGPVMRMVVLPPAGDTAGQVNGWLCLAGAVLFAGTAVSWQWRGFPVRSTGR